MNKNMNNNKNNLKQKQKILQKKISVFLEDTTFKASSVFDKSAQ